MKTVKAKLSDQELSDLKIICKKLRRSMSAQVTILAINFINSSKKE